MSAVPEIEVAAAIIERGGKFLIAQRPADDFLGGVWEFPGGKRETGEDLEACLVRELDEELAIRIEVGDLWKVVSHAYPDRKVRLHFYRCRLPSGEPRPLGCQAFRWVEPRELRQFSFPPADAVIIEELSNTPCREKS